jgi:hypothetical protein
MAFQLNLNPELESKLEAYCRKTAASKTGVIRLALESFLNSASLVPPPVKSKPVQQPPRGKQQTDAVSRQQVPLPASPSYPPITGGKTWKAK